MTAHITPLWRRLSHALAITIVRAWPHETRDWGHAFAAELAAVPTFYSSVSWLLGGLKMLLKERVRQLWDSLARPFGLGSKDSLDTSYKAFSRFPRLPRVAVAFLLIASIAILLHPEVRSGETGLFRFYSLTSFDPHTWDSTQQLRNELQKHRDPELLALLSLISTDDAERMRFSGEAIEKDSALTWLDYEQSLNPTSSTLMPYRLPADRLARLQNWDADNAVNQLLNAENFASSINLNTFGSAIRRTLDGQPPAQLVANRDWLAAMHRAFSAPRYDNYVPQLLQLIREVSNRYHVRDSELALHVLLHSRLIHFEMVRAYTDHLAQRALDAEKLGNFSVAADNYREILAFANRMSLGQSLPAEKYFADDLAIRACEKLQPALAFQNRPEEYALVSYQLAHLRESHDMRIMSTVPVHYSNWESVAWAGLQINLTALFIVAFFGIALATFLLLWVRRNVSIPARTWFDSTLSVSADVAPILLFLSCGLFYILYHSYAQICSDFFASAGPTFDFERLITAAAVVHAMPATFGLIVDPLLHWTVITIGLFLLAATLLFHMFIVRKRANPQPA